MRELRLNLGSTHCRNSHPWLLERTHREIPVRLPMSFERRRWIWQYRCPSPPGHRQRQASQNIRRMVGRHLSLVRLLHTEPRVAVGRSGLLPWTYGGAKGCRYVAKYEAKEGSSLLRRNPPMNRLWVLPGVARDSMGEIDLILDRSNRFVLIRLQSQVEGIAIFLTMWGLWQCPFERIGGAFSAGDDLRRMGFHRCQQICIRGSNNRKGTCLPDWTRDGHNRQRE